MGRIHHTAICSTDIDASLRFWRDGLGFEVTMDLSFDGDWPELFGARSERLRSVFLGRPGEDSGYVELVDFGHEVPGAGRPAGPAQGFFLVSVYTDVDAALDRLDALGLGGTPRRITVSGVAMAVVHDPDGVRVELIHLPPGANG